jgi:hypothetical protein
MASLQNLTDAKTIGGPVENVALAPAGQRFSLPEIRQAITSWNATAHDAVSAPQHTGHTAQELRHVQAILSDPRVVAVVDESLQKSINGTEVRCISSTQLLLTLCRIYWVFINRRSEMEPKHVQMLSSRIQPSSFELFGADFTVALKVQLSKSRMHFVPTLEFEFW